MSPHIRMLLGFKVVKISILLTVFLEEQSQASSGAKSNREREGVLV